ncbi:MAG: family 43 glycosylhydrolase [Pyrinomonadaceae bacterium]
MISARFVAAILSLVLVVANVTAQRRGTYSNPVVAGDFPDPSVIRVGADYWATTTTGTWAPFFPLLHSRDLVNWRIAGYVFQQRPAWAARDFWAPEIIQDRGRFFVYYAARRNEGANKRGTLCVAVATAARAEGPYTDHGPLVCQDIGSIDPFFVRDERGEPYLIWKEDGNDRNQPTVVWAQPLTADGTKLTGQRKEILRNDAPWERNVTEGSYILRRGAWFYHFYAGSACCGRSCDYAVGVARAHKLLGPWEKYKQNPIITANKDWQCPGHGSIVTTPDGRTFLLYHSYRQRRDTFNIGREAILDEVQWGADGWPIVNGGQGPSSVAPAPLGIAQSTDAGEFFDDFNRPELKLEWQWPMFSKQTVLLVTLCTGHLLLGSEENPPSDEWTGAVIARRVTSGDYVATTLVETRDSAASVRAGLAAYSWRDAAVGIAVGGGKVMLWRREGKEQRTLASVPAPVAPAVYLRMTASAGELYRFAYGTDGRTWTELGGPVNGSYIEGAHVALTAGGALGKAAIFDWIRITPQRPTSATGDGRYE